jgi:hypothetical protein
VSSSGFLLYFAHAFHPVEDVDDAWSTVTKDVLSNKRTNHVLGTSMVMAPPNNCRVSNSIIILIVAGWLRCTILGWLSVVLTLRNGCWLRQKSLEQRFCIMCPCRKDNGQRRDEGETKRVVLERVLLLRRRGRCVMIGLSERGSSVDEFD